MEFMKILEHLNSDNLMLVNVIHHAGNKNTDYNDYLDIVYKDLKTGEKFVKTIENPEMEIYFTQEEDRTFKFNKTHAPFNELEMHTVPFKDVEYYIAKQAGSNYLQYVTDAYKSRNRGKAKNIHKYRYVFGSDYDIENWYRIQWYLHNDNEKKKPITKQFLDIEVDSIDTEGFPRDGECPINAVTIVDQDSMTCFTFLLRNEKNPQIAEFEADIENFVDELHELFDETYGTLEYKIYMYDDEMDLIRDMFKLINTLKRDFLMIWNMGFDIPYIIARIEELGEDPTELICHPDFEIKEMFYKKDTNNYKVENKSDFFKASSYTTYLDQMIIYAGLRKGGGELRSNALNAVAQKEIGDEKLDYSEDANIKTLPYVDFKKFVIYNIKDVLLQMGIENKTGDIDNIYQRSYTNATSYNKIFKQTIFLKNRAYIEYYKQGLIIGNNINVEYGVPRMDKKDADEEKFDGAIVANPVLNGKTGINLIGSPSMYIFDNVVDMDFSSMYPHIIIAFNVSPGSMIGKLLVDREYKDIYSDVEGKKEDAGKDFMDNLLSDNVGNMAIKWFGLPSLTELNEDFKKKFNVNKKNRLDIRSNDVNTYFLENLTIDI